MITPSDQNNANTVKQAIFSIQTLLNENVKVLGNKMLEQKKTPPKKTGFFSYIPVIGKYLASDDPSIKQNEEEMSRLHAISEQFSRFRILANMLYKQKMRLTEPELTALRQEQQALLDLLTHAKTLVSSGIGSQIKETSEKILKMLEGPIITHASLLPLASSTPKAPQPIAESGVVLPSAFVAPSDAISKENLLRVVNFKTNKAGLVAPENQVELEIITKKLEDDAIIIDPQILSITDTKGNSILMLAIHNGHPRIVNALLSRKVNVNHTSLDGNSALLEATAKKDLLLVKRLIAGKANISQRRAFEEFSVNAIILAESNDAMDIVKYLNETVELAHTDKIEAINFAAFQGNIPLISYWFESLQFKPDVISAALTVAIAANQKKVIQFIIDILGNKPSLITPLLTFSLNEHNPVATTLLIHALNQKPAFINYVLHKAILQKNTKLIKVLLKNIQDHPVLATEVLERALEQKQNKIVNRIQSLLIEYPHLLNSILKQALLTKQERIYNYVLVLLKNNPKLAKYIFDKSLASQNAESLDFLLTHELAPKNERALNQPTLLMQAASRGQSGIVEVFLKHQTDIGAILSDTADKAARDPGYDKNNVVHLVSKTNIPYNRVTALTLAVDNGHYNTVKLLLEKNKALQTKSVAGIRLLDRADLTEALSKAANKCLLATVNDAALKMLKLLARHSDHTQIEHVYKNIRFFKNLPEAAQKILLERRLNSLLESQSASRQYGSVQQGKLSFWQRHSPNTIRKSQLALLDNLEKDLLGSHLAAQAFKERNPHKFQQLQKNIKIMLGALNYLSWQVKRETRFSFWASSRLEDIILTRKNELEMACKVCQFKVDRTECNQAFYKHFTKDAPMDAINPPPYFKAVQELGFWKEKKYPVEWDQFKRRTPSQSN